MNCYQCATRAKAVPAIATCTHCGIGICLEHFQAEQDYRVSGATYGCRHGIAARAKASATAHSSGHTRHWLRAAR